MTGLAPGVSDREATLLLEIFARLKKHGFGRLTVTVSDGRVVDVEVSEKAASGCLCLERPFALVEEEHMTAHRILTVITTALFSLIVLGCVGPAGRAGVALENAGPAPVPTAGLCGTWQGEFSYVGSDHQSSTGSSDLVLEVGGDSTYTLRWGNRRPSTGTVTARGNRLILDDESGSRITLVHSGDTLYGATKDQVDGRPTMMSLGKREPALSRLAATSPRC